MGTNSCRSLSSFSSANSYILRFAAHVLLDDVPPELSLPNPAIFTVVLAINDKHTLAVRHLPTISPFGIDGN
jgi:hypothetical protein